MLRRPRRNRKSSSIRSMVQETRLTPSNLVSPLFVSENPTEPIASMPNIYRLSATDLLKEVERCWEKGITSVLLFPYVNHRDKEGDEILNPEGILPKAISALKQRFPELCVMCDVTLDPYTSHGHDGLVSEGEILNDKTVEVLAKAAVMLAQAGVDIIAPSDMMDGRVLAIRKALDSAECHQVSILSYSAKYASSFYGPFRDALDSSPKFGDKLSYQLNPANVREALLECRLDQEEGADILMIKPAMAYLDVIRRVREETYLPVAAYHVSGEYSMIMAAAERGWLNADAALMEATMAIKRAGADLIITYAACSIADSLLHR